MQGICKILESGIFCVTALQTHPVISKFVPEKAEAFTNLNHSCSEFLDV